MSQLTEDNYLTPNEKILRNLSVKFGIPYKDVKKIVNHNFWQMSKAFAKKGVTSIEWVGLGKFVVSEPRAKHFLVKQMSKLYNGKAFIESEGPTSKMLKSVEEAQKNVDLLKTKIKDEQIIEYLRGMEEQLASKKFPNRRNSEDLRGENGDMQEL